MTAAPAPPPASTVTADLVLVRMALPGKTSPPPSKVREDVGRLLGTPLPAAEFDPLRRALAADGFLVPGRRNSFAVTPAGRERAARFLGLEQMPRQLRWDQAVARHLFPQAAGLPAEQAAKLSSGDKLAALVVRAKYRLPTAPGGTLAKALEALVCQQVGHPEETTLAGLLRAVLSRAVGAGGRLTKAQLLRQVPLYDTGLPSGTAAAVRRKLVADWLTAGGAAVPAAADAPAAAEEPFDLPAFAHTVLTLARVSPPADRFHDTKVFIAPLWRSSQREPNFPRLTLPQFKRKLVEANREGLLHLSRADLVQAMDPRLVTESETTHLTATFHFVRLEGDRP